jgi:hypothetical protein
VGEGNARRDGALNTPEAGDLRQRRGCSLAALPYRLNRLEAGAMRGDGLDPKVVVAFAIILLLVLAAVIVGYVI